MRYIVDDIGTVVKAMRTPKNNVCPNYMYGHRLEINNRLKAMLTGSKKNDRYPLVFLRLDIPETVKDDVKTMKLNLGIMTFTDEKYDAPQRYEKVFKPKLYPLYESFMEQLRISGLFMYPLGKYPPHVKIDRPFWGTSTLEGNQQKIFDDPLDAIEIVDLTVSQKIKKC